MVLKIQSCAQKLQAPRISRNLHLLTSPQQFSSNAPQAPQISLPPLPFVPRLSASRRSEVVRRIAESPTIRSRVLVPHKRDAASACSSYGQSKTTCVRRRSLHK